MDLSAASFAYPEHDGPIRAALADRLRIADPPEAGFVLSSCLRVEVVVPGPEPMLELLLLDLFADLGNEAAPRIRTGERAVSHLFRIASGLESPILGEQEILTQYRQGLIEAEERGAVSGVFARLLESAIAVGREARTLLPGSPHNSMAAVAAQAVGPSDRVAVFGSGIMANAVVEGLVQLPAPPKVTVVARNPEKVQSRPGVDVVGFEHAQAALVEFPAVISATSAKRRLLDDELVADLVSRRDRQLLLVDMAMPPDFTPPKTHKVTYLNIDDLARLGDRRSRAEEADTFVESAATEAFRRYREHHELGPLVGGLMGSADRVVETAMRKFAGRLQDAADEPVLRQAAHTVARSLLARPISYLKTADRAPEAIDVIAAAFAVDDD